MVKIFPQHGAEMIRSPDMRVNESNLELRSQTVWSEFVFCMLQLEI